MQIESDDPRGPVLPEHDIPLVTRSRASTARAWVIPFFVLAAITLLFVLIGEIVDGRGALSRALHKPDGDVANAVLGNIAQVVSQVLGVAISVVAIIVELAANRYTHRITELFFRATVNFLVMGLFVVSCIVPMWVSFTYANGHGPVFITILCMGLMTVSVLLLLPYFAYVAAFVNPLNVIHRMRNIAFSSVGLSVRSTITNDELINAQASASSGAEQLSDVAVNAMNNHDKAIAMEAVNAIGHMLHDYIALKSQLVAQWFKLSRPVRTDPDFFSLAEEAVAQIEDTRTWFEFKLLREYESIYRTALNESRELCYLIAANTREVGEQAMGRIVRARALPPNEREAEVNEARTVLDLSIKFFNTYLRATLNKRDVRTAYNVFNQYRLFGETALRTGNSAVAVAITRHFKFYGQTAFQLDLGFVLETVAYDLCALNTLAFDLKAKERKVLLKEFLQVDKEGEGAKREAALRGVRKAQVKLAVYYLFKGDEAAAREVFHDMEQEKPTRLASIRDELRDLEDQYYWEVIDRGTNFDWIPPEQRPFLMQFFEWFGAALPEPRSSMVPSSGSVPEIIPPDRTSGQRVLSSEIQVPGTPGAERRSG